VILPLTDDLKHFVYEHGADLVGVAPINRLKDAPLNHHPSRFLEDASCVVSMGIRLNKATVNNLPVTRRSYGIQYEVVNAQLNSLAYLVARFLEERGYRAVAIPASEPYDDERFAGDLSHRHVAHAAGLGEFGLSNLLLTPKYGSRIRFVSVITNAPLEASPPFRGHICDECRKCVDACPSRALEANLDKHSWTTGRRIDYEKCNHYMSSVLRGLPCGMCIKACPIGENPHRNP